MNDPSFQDQGAVPFCYGCGADNKEGLQIKSYWDGDEAVGEWRPQPHHCGGRKNIVNGGIIATLIDCHSLNLAIATAYRNEQRPIGSAPRIGYVTAHLDVNYLKPAPLDSTLQLRARVARIDGRKAWINCTVSADGEVRAAGEVLGIRVERD
jgi:acyl-coenzyme A thioesterase PaaI-like protein